VRVFEQRYRLIEPRIIHFKTIVHSVTEYLISLYTFVLLRKLVYVHASLQKVDAANLKTIILQLTITGRPGKRFYDNMKSQRNQDLDTQELIPPFTIPPGRQCSRARIDKTADKAGNRQVRRGKTSASTQCSSTTSRIDVSLRSSQNGDGEGDKIHRCQVDTPIPGGGIYPSKEMDIAWCCDTKKLTGGAVEHQFSSHVHHHL
jgi:hypothetical protein